MEYTDEASYLEEALQKKELKEGIVDSKFFFFFPKVFILPFSPVIP